MRRSALPSAGRSNECRSTLGTKTVLSPTSDSQEMGDAHDGFANPSTLQNASFIYREREDAMSRAGDPTPGTPGAGDPRRRTFDAVAEAIREHGDELRALDGVVSVRPGYRFQDGWITDEPAVVVTVLPERQA